MPLDKNHIIIASRDFIPDLDQAKNIRNWFDLLSPRLELATEDLQNVKLAVSEIFTNCVKHAETVAETVLIEVCKEGDNLFVNIKDNGSPFSGYEEKTKIMEGDANTIFSESGMGLRLVKSFFPVQLYRPKSSNESEFNELRIQIKTGMNDKSKPKIAIVDDDMSTRMVLAVYLSESYQVIEYDSPFSAIDSLKDHPVDLVLSDINMPDMNGFAFRSKLGQHPQTDTIPFIFLTAEEHTDSHDKAAELGVDDYLVKPVSRDQLLNVIKRTLTRVEKLKLRLGERLDKAITNSLRPSLPEKIGQFELSLRSRTASAGGGDFVLHFNYPSYDMIIFGDIMGHGEQAKFFAHAHAGYFHGLMQATKITQSPALCLKQLSSAIESSSVLEATLVTCIAIKLNHDGSINFASAGHPPPLLLDDNVLITLNSSGALPGLVPDQDYEEHTLSLGTGRLFFYTDGLFESAPTADQRQHLEDEIKLVMQQTGNLSPGIAIDKIMNLFDHKVSSDPSDDVTLFLLQTSRYN